MHPLAEEWFENLEGDRQKLALRIRETILQANPLVSLEWKWDCPFFVYRKNLLYLNKHKDGLDVGFYLGHLLSDANGALESRGKKQVRFFHYKSMADFSEEVFLEVLHEAMLLNEKP